MDLISTIASQTGLDPQQAQALAGSFLSTVQAHVADEDDAAAAQLGAAVPELGDWQQQAQAMLAQPKESGGGGGLFGSLTSMASSGLGNQLLGAVAGEEAAKTAQFAALLQNFGLDASQATMAAGPALTFLKERMPATWIDTAMQAMPLLAKLDRDGDGLDAGDIAALFGG